MDRIIERLNALGLAVPDESSVGCSTTHCRRAGHLLFVSGICSGEQMIATSEKDTETLYSIGQNLALRMLANIRDEVGDLHHVTQVVKATIFVHAKHGFSQMPAAAHGFSDVFTVAYGEKGRHARAAMGAAALAGNAALLAEIIVEVR